MKNVLPPSSTFTNMRILDTEHTKDMYERLLRQTKRVCLNLKAYFVLQYRI